MFTLVVTIRKKPHLSTQEFRRLWKEEYAPFYRLMPQVRSYVQYHLDDRRKDEAEDPIDGLAILTFDSEAAMHEAWATEPYAKAKAIRETFLRATAVGVHVASVSELFKVV